jgi:hypothetical protein
MDDKKPQLFEYSGGRIRWVSGDTPPDPLARLHELERERATGPFDKGWEPNKKFTLTPDRGRGNPWEDKKKVA